MTATYYENGNAVYTYALIRDDGGDLIEPGGLTLTLLKPDDTQEVLEIGDLTEESVGRYSYTWVPDQDGLWRYRWASNNPDAASEDHFHVSVSHFYP